MHLSAASLAFIAAALTLALALQVVHTGFTGFSGDSCDGSVGRDVPCDGSCHQFGGRNSFRVDAGSGSHCVTMFLDQGCPVGGEGFTFINEDGNCQTVDTGTEILSFVCAPKNVCLL